MKVKRLLAMVLCMCIAFSCGTSTSAASAIEVVDRTRLASLNTEECEQFLADMGVIIPDGVNKEFARNIVAELEEDSDKLFFFNKVETTNFIEAARMAVKKYLAQNSPTGYYTSTGYVLKQSTLWRWDNSMPNYNCYAYALGRTDGRYDPGYFCGESIREADTSYFIANLAKDDLQKTLGYYCVKIDSNLPTYSSSSPWVGIMALRADFDQIATSNGDYHFAKLMPTGWLHKPGGSGILKFKIQPNEEKWIHEYYDGIRDEYGSLGYDYESDIQYIYYKQNHNATITYTGNNYHSGSLHYAQYRITGSCSSCNAKGTFWTYYACSGNPCVIPSSIIPEPEIS